MFNDWMKKISELKDIKSVTWGECPNGAETEIYCSACAVIKALDTDIHGLTRI